MHKVDQVSATWRTGPCWSYKTIHRSELMHDKPSFPEFLQLHPDVWIAYEWNYHRTARIILHRHLLECLDRLEVLSTVNDSHLLNSISSYKGISVSLIRSLIDEVFSTVPQMLGDIDHEGRILEGARGTAMCKGIGGYFLLWPIKVIKGTSFATTDQRSYARNVSERIRDCTGMKTALGDASKIED